MREAVKLNFYAVRNEYNGEWFGVVRAEGAKIGSCCGGISERADGGWDGRGFDSPEAVAAAIEDMLAKLRQEDWTMTPRYAHIRYLVFVGDRYYPDGGWRDFIGGHAELTDAITAASTPSQVGSDDRPYDWAHVVDLETLSIVWPLQ